MSQITEALIKNAKNVINRLEKVSPYAWSDMDLRDEAVRTLVVLCKELEIYERSLDDMSSALQYQKSKSSAFPTLSVRNPKAVIYIYDYAEEGEK
jgi:hypothetical protein